MSQATRRLLAWAFVVYAVVLAFVLLNPSSAGPSAAITRLASLGERLDLPAPLVAAARIEFGLNVLVFMPLSFLGALLRPRVPLSVWTAGGFAGSLLVEVIQVLMPDRSATHSDVVANTLGAASGAIAARVVTAYARRRQ